jgi:hypothetical protein
MHSPYLLSSPHGQHHWSGCCIIRTQKTTGLDGDRHITIGEFQSVIAVRIAAIAAAAAADAAAAAAAAWVVL